LLDALVGEGRVQRDESEAGVRYRSRTLVLGFDDPAGWEAAVLDHYCALVRTIGKKLSVEQRAAADDEVGGSTYHFALHRGHPMEEEVLGQLRSFRAQCTALRERVDRHNAENGVGADPLQVTAYFGQCVVEAK
jgi:hypothetical protein